jgi:hypothetical protein
LIGSGVLSCGPPLRHSTSTMSIYAPPKSPSSDVTGP